MKKILFSISLCAVFLCFSTTASAVETTSTETNKSETKKASEIQTSEPVTRLSFKKTTYDLSYDWHKTITPVITSDNRNVKLKYISSNKKVAKVSQDGLVTGTGSGKATITVKALDGSKASASYKVVVKKESKGWHKTKSGKKYYIKADRKRAYGYTKIKDKNGNYNYFFFDKNSCMVTSKWKYVTISGRKYKLYFNAAGKQVQNTESIIGEQPYYMLEVNLTQNLIIAYAKDGDNGYIIPVRAMLCSVGTPGHDTPTGNYYNLEKAGEQWGVLLYNSFGKYCTRITGPFLFHSAVYTAYGDNYALDPDEYEKLGTAASHGCIRLTVKNAKWIQDRYYKSGVSIFYSNKKPPLKRPAVLKAVRLQDGRAYDPTDPDIK